MAWATSKPTARARRRTKGCILEYNAYTCPGSKQEGVRVYREQGIFLPETDLHSQSGLHSHFQKEDDGLLDDYRIGRKEADPGRG